MSCSISEIWSLPREFLFIQSKDPCTNIDKWVSSSLVSPTIHPCHVTNGHQKRHLKSTGVRSPPKALQKKRTRSRISRGNSDFAVGLPFCSRIAKRSCRILAWAGLQYISAMCVVLLRTSASTLDEAYFAGGPGGAWWGAYLDLEEVRRKGYGIVCIVGAGLFVRISSNGL